MNHASNSQNACKHNGNRLEKYFSRLACSHVNELENEDGTITAKLYHLKDVISKLLNGTTLGEKKKIAAFSCELSENSPSLVASLDFQ